LSRAHVALLIVVAALAALLFLTSKSEHAAESVNDSNIDDPPPRGYVCYRARSPIVIDGKLNDSAWADAPWSEPFVDIEGDKQPKPRWQTHMKMLWDDTALYIAAELEEPHVWATLNEHDSVIFHDPDFEVFLDPDCDSHVYGELELNALNTTWDLLLTKPYKDGGRPIDSWEIKGLKTATHVDGTLNDPSDTDRGWTVEIAWPWTSIKEMSKLEFFPPRDGDQWRINFSRVEWDIDIVNGKYQKVPKRPEHNWVWSPQGVIDMHRPEKWGILQFSTAPPGTAVFHPDPAQPARDYLHRVYYAQHAYHKRFGHYADSLAALGPSVRVRSGSLANPRLEVTTHGFEASVELVLNGNRERWRIMQDAWIGKE
jgi:hypothetical protein